MTIEEVRKIIKFDETKTLELLVFKRPNHYAFDEMPPKMAENVEKTAKNGGKVPFPLLSFQLIHDAIVNNPKIKYAQLEASLNVGETTIRRAIKWMKDNGYIDAIHSKVNGIWQIK